MVALEDERSGTANIQASKKSVRSELRYEICPVNVANHGHSSAKQ